MNLLGELQRRSVFRVAAAYAVAAWLIVQVGDIAADSLGFPGWFMPMLFVLLGLGFPIALILSWAFELTPQGVKRSADIAGDGSVRPGRGHRVDRLIAIALAVLIVVLVAERFWSAGEVEAVADARPSIAVLAFANLSADPENAFFAEGISEEILNLLAAVEDLSVASRTSAFSYRDDAVPIPEIARSLGVRYVLEGSVRRADDRVRVTAQLIDAERDRHLWSETFDRTLDDIFAIQDEIAGAIGDALQVELLGADGRTVSSAEISPALYEKFLQSRFLLRQRNQAALGRAIELLQEVVEGEPEYAPGLAQLAEAYLLSGGIIDNDQDLQERLDLILGLVDRALAIDSSLAGAFAVRGNVAMTRGAYVDALHDYRLAIELDPDDPRSHHWLALLYSDAGHLDRGERAIAESLRLDPENANAQGWRGDLLAARGEWEAALDVAREVVDLGNPVGHAYIAMYLLALDPMGNLDRAESELRLALTRGTPPNQVPLKIVEVARGDEAALESVLDDVRGNRLWLYIAMTALLAVERGEAVLTLLEGNDFLYHRLALLAWSSEHAPLRRDPRFVDYVRRQGVTELWREIGPPPDCRQDGATWRCGLTGEGG